MDVIFSLVLKVNYVISIPSKFAFPNLKNQACFSQMFPNVNIICLESTSKTQVCTYKLLFLVSRVLCLFVDMPVKKLHSLNQGSQSRFSRPTL